MKSFVKKNWYNNGLKLTFKINLKILLPDDMYSRCVSLKY